MINKYSNEHTNFKNPNWQEANQQSVFKRSREAELGATENNIEPRDLNPRPTDLKSGVLTTRPRYLHFPLRIGNFVYYCSVIFFFSPYLFSVQFDKCE